MNTRTIRSLTALVGIAALALSVTLTAGPANASGTVTRGGATRTTVVAHHAAVPYSPAATSVNGAGFFISLAGVTTISLQFTAPATSCASDADQEWLLPGIWLSTSGSTDQWVSTNLNCNDPDHGGAFRREDSCVNGNVCDISWDVQPGDRIRMSIAIDGSTTTGTVTDVTQDLTVQLVGSETTDDTAFIGDLGGSSYIVTAVPTFSKVVFTQVKINGAPLSTASPSRYSLQNGTDVQIATGNIRHDGQSFVTTFRRNY